MSTSLNYYLEKSLSLRSDFQLALIYSRRSYLINIRYKIYQIYFLWHVKADIPHFRSYNDNAVTKKNYAINYDKNLCCFKNIQFYHFLCIFHPHRHE